MTTSFALHLLGYAASALIVASMMMRSIVRLRMLNLAGAVTFSLYGFLIGAWPVGILNLLTASINVIQLARLRRRREIFRILEINPHSQYVRYFLDFQRDDIRRFFPEFRFDPEEINLSLFVLRDLVPAGLMLGILEGETFQVRLDYVVPQYRDLKIGRYLFYDQSGFFRERGAREIVSPAGTAAHSAYLHRLGFRRAGDGSGYRLPLA
ncbi:MAG TPA: hypothetical protein VM534_11410 [Thermoanaerobaculia bacterium]|nr:hypothetical protein [Thermoanaerobaculia bacterium]